MGEGSPILLPGRYEPRFAGVFAWWVGRMLRRDFCAVRLAREHASLLADLAAHPGPIVGVSNHQSWWDPLVFVLLHRRFTPERASIGPIEAEQWRRFGFMKRLGLFGVDPHDPRSAASMVEHVVAQLKAEPRMNFWITPQGEFVDVRRPVRIRPGVSMVAAAAGTAGLDVRGVSIAVEYPFWVDRRPELLLRLAPIRAPEAPTTTGWHRSITRAMRSNQEALAGLSMARDVGAFITLAGGETRINPLYDLWQRVRGRSGAIRARRFEGSGGTLGP